MKLLKSQAMSMLKIKIAGMHSETTVMGQIRDRRCK